MFILGPMAQIMYYACIGQEHELSEDKRMAMSGPDPRLKEQNTSGRMVREGISPRT